MTMSQLMRFIDTLPTGALSSGSGIAWEEETAKFSQPVLLPKSAVSFPLSSTLAFGIPNQLDHFVQTCSVVLLRGGLCYTAPIFRSTMVADTQGVYLHPGLRSGMKGTASSVRQD